MVRILLASLFCPPQTDDLRACDRFFSSLFVSAAFDPVPTHDGFAKVALDGPDFVALIGDGRRRRRFDVISKAKAERRSQTRTPTVCPAHRE